MGLLPCENTTAWHRGRQDDPKLNAEQKEAQIARLEDFGQKLGRLEPLLENYALVEQMKDKVAPIMNLE